MYSPSRNAPFTSTTCIAHQHMSAIVVWSPDYELSMEQQQAGIINLFADEYLALVDQDHRLVGSRGRDDLDLGWVPRTSDTAIFAVG